MLKGEKEKGFLRLQTGCISGRFECQAGHI